MDLLIFTKTTSGNDFPGEVIRVIEANILVHLYDMFPPKNLPHTYHLDHLRLYNPS
jgi:hypothetical protein